MALPVLGVDDGVRNGVSAVDHPIIPHINAHMGNAICLVGALEEGLVHGAVLEGQVGAQGLGVDLPAETGMLQQALDLAAEQQLPLAGLGIVERFDAEHIAGAEELLLLRVPDNKGKHAAQLLHKLAPAVLLIAVQQHLGVAVRRKGVPRRDKLLAQRLKVVDLAVVDQHKTLVFVVHRLRTVRKVNDAQATEAERHIRVGIRTRAVRSAVDDQIHHVLHDLTLVFDFSGKPDDTAHSKIPVYESISLTNIVYHKRYEQSRYAKGLFSRGAKTFFGKFAKGLDNLPLGLYNIKVLDGKPSASLIKSRHSARVAELADAHV